MSISEQVEQCIYMPQIIHAMDLHILVLSRSGRMLTMRNLDYLLSLSLSLSFFLSSPALYAPDGVFCLTKTSRTPSWPKTLPSADADRHQKPRQPRLPRSKRRPKFFDGPPQRRFLVSFSFKGGRACEYQDSVIISSIREKSGFSDLRSSTSASMAPTAAPLDPTRTRPGKCAAEFLEPPCEMFKMIRQLGVVAFGWFGG